MFTAQLFFFSVILLTHSSPILPKRTSFGSCSLNGVNGTCQETSITCAGGFNVAAVGCPMIGEVTLQSKRRAYLQVQCCLDSQPSLGDCSFQGVNGICQDTSTTCAGGFNVAAVGCPAIGEVPPLPPKTLSRSLTYRFNVVCHLRT